MSRSQLYPTALLLGTLAALGGASCSGGTPGSTNVTTGTGGSDPGASAGSDGNQGAGGASSGAGGQIVVGGTGGAAAPGGTGGSAACGSEPPAASELIGWASQPGMGLNGPTTGGGSAAPIRVSTNATFISAIAGTAPAVVYLTATLTGNFSVGSNKTVVGLCGAGLHGHLDVRSSNVIVRNLKIVGYGVGDCSLDPSYDATVGCSSGADAVTIQGGAHHVWFDHDDISDGTDGNLDITSGSDFVTISWTKFHYTLRADPVGNDSTGASGHRFSNLIGSADNVPGDVGHLNVTWHHDWWADNVNQRMPRSRYGKIHMLNNLFTAVGDSYCTNAGLMATLLVEGNVYSGVRAPLQPATGGDILAPTTGPGVNLFTNTTGLTTSAGVGFVPPYAYTPEPATSVAAAVMAGAGPQ